MRKTILTESFVRFSRRLTGIALLAAVSGIASCETHSNSDRNESIAVYADPTGKEPIAAAYVDVRGGLARIYVDSNIDFAASWQDDATTPWVSLLPYYTVDPQTGRSMVTMNVQRRSKTSSY